MRRLSRQQILFLTVTGTVTGLALALAESPLWAFAVAGALITSAFVILTAPRGGGVPHGEHQVQRAREPAAPAGR